MRLFWAIAIGGCLGLFAAPEMAVARCGSLGQVREFAFPQDKQKEQPTTQDTPPATPKTDPSNESKTEIKPDSQKIEPPMTPGVGTEPKNAPSAAPTSDSQTQLKVDSPVAPPPNEANAQPSQMVAKPQGNVTGAPAKPRRRTVAAEKGKPRKVVVREGEPKSRQHRS